MANWLKDEMKEGSERAEKLIDYAADKLGRALDERIERLKTETGDLITAKLSEIRREMSDAAEIQKKSAVRNLTVAVCASLLVAAVSATYRRYVANEVDLYFVFRSVVLAVAVGHAMWLISKAISNYVNASKLKKDAAFYASQYFGVFRIRGIAGHLIVLTMLVAVLLYINFWMG